MIEIDRLVFDVPGLTADRAERLARQIGAMLAAPAPGGAGKGQDKGEEKVDVLLPPGREASDEAILAAFAAALRTRAV